MRQGFTVIELLVVIGLFGILMVAGVNFLVQVMQNTNKSAVENEVRQNANSVMQKIVGAIRNSGCVKYSYNPIEETPLELPPLSQRDLIVTTYSDNCVTPSQEFIVYYNPADDPQNPTTTGIVTLDGQPINSAKTMLVSCPEASTCNNSNWPQICARGLNIAQRLGSKAWQIDLNMQQGAGASRWDFCAQTKLSDSATPRL